MHASRNRTEVTTCRTRWLVLGGEGFCHLAFVSPLRIHANLSIVCMRIVPTTTNPVTVNEGRHPRIACFTSALPLYYAHHRLFGRPGGPDGPDARPDRHLPLGGRLRWRRGEVAGLPQRLLERLPLDVRPHRRLGLAELRRPGRQRRAYQGVPEPLFAQRARRLRRGGHRRLQRRRLLRGSVALRAQHEHEPLHEQRARPGEGRVLQRDPHGVHPEQCSRLRRKR